MIKLFPSLATLRTRQDRYVELPGDRGSKRLRELNDGPPLIAEPHALEIFLAGVGLLAGVRLGDRSALVDVSREVEEDVGRLVAGHPPADEPGRTDHAGTADASPAVDIHRPAGIHLLVDHAQSVGNVLRMGRVEVLERDVVEPEAPAFPEGPLVIDAVRTARAPANTARGLTVGPQRDDRLNACGPERGRGILVRRGLFSPPEVGMDLGGVPYATQRGDERQLLIAFCSRGYTL